MPRAATTFSGVAGTSRATDWPWKNGRYWLSHLGGAPSGNHAPGPIHNRPAGGRVRSQHELGGACPPNHVGQVNHPPVHRDVESGLTCFYRDRQDPRKRMHRARTLRQANGGTGSLAPDQIGAILAVTAVILGLITRSRVSPLSATLE